MLYSPGYGTIELGSDVALKGEKPRATNLMDKFQYKLESADL